MNEELKEALKATLENYLSVAKSGDAGNWDPEAEHAPETALASDALERFRLLPAGWSSALPEPARFEALRAATVPHFAALCGAALLGRVALENG
mgnify:CR=1 FL=1